MAPSIPTPNENHLRTALHHARIIQAQKDIESLIFTNLETLLDYPLSSPPSTADISSFQTLIAPFQPSDYDELLTERHCAKRCAWVLCPNPPPPPKRGKWAIVGNTSATIKVVDAKSLDLWCSPECARRAMYVKVQLNEEPAWLRRAGAAPRIEVPVEMNKADRGKGTRGEDSAEDAAKLKEAGSKAPATVTSPLESDNSHLRAALENIQSLHDTSNDVLDSLVTDVVEKDAVKPPTAPSLDDEAMDAIEGYQSKGAKLKTVNEEEDDQRTDWVHR
ncbi:hypothetical protein EJ06DRAFT_501287 [Trichodelitschia bisporula]|uniref:RNA polymerase II subunit B1 CTD phosphatase RPAP2 homolog n=1 Tax=Trichodelitschia bisporula TaxID=703511 RepID=A0A6G1HII3_9PEZI|nr:hypothetical protein EJ06DRAFT_501287 [Trichodelitschia bisporula]